MRKKKLIVLGKIVGASLFLTTILVGFGTTSAKKLGSVRQGEPTKFAVQNEKLVAKPNQKEDM